MKLIDEVFKKYKLKEDNLINYGFIYNDGIYSFNKLIHENSFKLQISIKDKKIHAKLIDLDFNEEYKLIDSIGSGFIESLNDECKTILIDIRDKCYYKEEFIFPQSNRISLWIKEKYNSIPEYLWESAPGYGVFRNTKTNKWFGIIMNIPKNKIIGNDIKEIEIFNVMLHEETQNYLNHAGIYPAYHMNKKHWVSILLDDTLPDDYIKNLINISYLNS